MTDTELLNKLEAFLCDECAERGLAILPYLLHRTGERRLSFYNVPREECDTIGDELCDAPTLRSVIEAL